MDPVERYAGGRPSRDCRKLQILSSQGRGGGLGVAVQGVGCAEWLNSRSMPCAVAAKLAELTSGLLEDRWVAGLPSSLCSVLRAIWVLLSVHCVFACITDGRLHAPSRFLSNVLSQTACQLGPFPLTLHLFFVSFPFSAEYRFLAPFSA